MEDYDCDKIAVPKSLTVINVVKGETYFVEFYNYSNSFFVILKHNGIVRGTLNGCIYKNDKMLYEFFELYNTRSLYLLRSAPSSFVINYATFNEKVNGLNFRLSESPGNIKVVVNYQYKKTTNGINPCKNMISSAAI